MHRSGWLGTAIAAALLCLSPDALASDVTLAIEDASALHVHAPGTPFSIAVTASAPGGSAKVFAQWVDYQSQPVGPPIEIAPATATDLSSFAGTVGYYGLRFFSDTASVAFPPQRAGFPSQEYGFAILPEKLASARQPDPDSLFGMTHVSILSDPYMAGASKTLTWNTASPGSWPARTHALRNAGFVEVPLVNGTGWESNDTEPIPFSTLDTLETRFRDYVLADPLVLPWVLGLEENGSERFSQPHYFDNLAAKSARCRSVADAHNPAIKLVYNLRGFTYASYEAVFASPAIANFQVFSTHPYRWTDFPTPEGWLVDHLRQVRTIMAAHGRGDMELWMGEFGLPVRGNNDPDGFFGYPSSGSEVPGATRDYAAQYLVKGHALAAQEGVAKIITYNYRNRGNDIEFAEHHFGLTSYSGDSSVPGHPLQSYVAYATMVDQLDGKRWSRSGRTGDVWVFDFADLGEGNDTLLAWMHPAGSTTVSWSDLRPGLGVDDVTGVVNLYGTPVPFGGSQVTITGQPVYIEVGTPACPGGCDDANPCTSDTCQGDTCVHTPLECNDGDACTADTCADGQCVFDPMIPCCGNATCEPGEDCGSCGADCATSSPGCGNGTCETAIGESCTSCPTDCNGKQNGSPSRRFCCGAGGGQNPVTCSDARCSESGFACTSGAVGSTCCGDGTCTDPETSCDCAADCGLPPPSELPATCVDGVDNDCDGATDCSDADCAAAGACACTPTHTNEKGKRCRDGRDNDCDGLVDGGDPDCQ